MVGLLSNRSPLVERLPAQRWAAVGAEASTITEPDPGRRSGRGGAMHLYGQYCPVARATEILADRWTPLIIRELLAGIRHFNDLDRGLPGISRALLVDRLRRLERTKLLERRQSAEGRVTEYHLTPAGRELQRVIDVLGRWGARWAFGDPRVTELDPIVLLWWMKRRVYRQRLPAG